MNTARRGRMLEQARKDIAAEESAHAETLNLLKQAEADRDCEAATAEKYTALVADLQQEVADADDVREKAVANEACRWRADSVSERAECIRTTDHVIAQLRDEEFRRAWAIGIAAVLGVAFVAVLAARFA